VEVNSIPIVRDGIVLYDVVAGIVEGDSIPVVRAYGVVSYFAVACFPEFNANTCIGEVQVFNGYVFRVYGNNLTSIFNDVIVHILKVYKRLTVHRVVCNFVVVGVVHKHTI